MASVDVVINTIDKGSSSAIGFVKGFGNAWKELATPINQTLELIGKVQRLGSDAFQFLEQGAQVNQVAESFNRLNASIFDTPDLLNQMRDASRGTIKDMDLMRGVLTLVAGVSEETGKQLADAAPRLLEIAKAANKLNPTLGDTAFLYESISTGIKRNSKLILDNLGIVFSTEEAYKAYADSVGKSASALSEAERQQAFLNATMKAGDNIIAQVGGNVDSAGDSFQQLKTIAGQTGDTIKSEFAEAIAPYLDDIKTSVEELGPAFAEMAKEGIPAMLSLAESLPTVVRNITKLVEDYEKYAAIYQKIKPVALGGTGFIVGNAYQSFIDFQEQLREFAESRHTRVYADDVERLAKNYENYAQVTSGYVGATNDITQAETEAREAIKNTAESLAYLALVGKDAGQATDDIIVTSEDMAAAQKKQSDAVKETADQVKMATEAYKELQAARGDYFTDALEEDFFKKAQYVTVGGRTDDQNETLEDLQAAYDKAAKTVKDYETGVKGFGMEQEKIAEATKEAADAMAYYAEKMGPLAAIQGELQQVSEAGWDWKALNDELYAQADAAGADASALAILKIATGELTDEQAIAALKTAAIKEKIVGLGKAIAEGLNPQKAIQDLKNFVNDIGNIDFDVQINPQYKYDDKLDRNMVANGGDLGTGFFGPAAANLTKTVKVDADTDEALVKIGEFNVMLADIPTLKDVYIRVHVDPASEKDDDLLSEIRGGGFKP